MNPVSRRALLAAGGAALGWTAATRFGAKLPILNGTQRLSTASGETILNDASGLSPTPVHRHIIIKDDPGTALISSIRTEMQSARNEGRPFNIGAARHSMGGQAIPRNGHALTFDNGWAEPDRANGTYKAHAGARWSQIIAKLDPLGWSPKVMQSNNDFGLAATFCVNAHGWPVPFGPMGSTVRSCRMILADGALVTCSRTENSALFNHAMGGYGLTGALVDMDIDMVPNTRMVPQFDVLPADGFAAAFDAALKDPEVTMAYGRLNVERATFFTKALLVTYRETSDQSDLPAAGASGWLSHMASHIYRAQLGNEALKSFRWWNETVAGPVIGSGEVTRNSVINEPVVTLDDRDPDRTDILHEYFIGFDRMNEFLSVCQDVIPASYQEFLNVTLRYVGTDSDSMLSYAPLPRIAAVMSLSQELTARAEADMQRMTRALIDRVTALGGSYYLPYRPHATREQFAKTYPRASEFAKFKREIDPDLVLRNALWDWYMETL